MGLDYRFTPVQMINKILGISNEDLGFGSRKLNLVCITVVCVGREGCESGQLRKLEKKDKNNEFGSRATLQWATRARKPTEEKDINLDDMLHDELTIHDFYMI